VNLLQNYKDQIFQVNNENFSQYALEIFRFQARHNEVYKTYIQYLNIEPEKISHIRQIPFLPIELFKRHQVKTLVWNEENIFRSSGTTGQEQSRHFIEDLAFYEENSIRIFEHFYGSLTDQVILALLPSYLERNDASLVYMVDRLIRYSGSTESGFYLDDHLGLLKKLEKLRKEQSKVILIGVSFALLDFAEHFHIDFPELTVMETGGMKGRRAEMTRVALHRALKAGFNVQKVHSEYGMTELLSQAYALENGAFETVPWMRIVLREVNDPFAMHDDIQSGGINVIDLANIHSCCFIETKDIGKYAAFGKFEVLGRMDNSDVRGCNLLVF